MNYRLRAYQTRTLTTELQVPSSYSGVEGIEPSYVVTKKRCLATWRHPTIKYNAFASNTTQIFMFTPYLKEVQARSLEKKGLLKLVVILTASKQKKKREEEERFIQLLQDHRFGFIGLPSQEKELRTQGLLCVGEETVLQAVTSKNNSIDKVLMNPSSLSTMSKVGRESLSFWKRMPNQKEDSFIYHPEQVHKHRGKEFSLKDQGNHSLSIPFGELHWKHEELNSQLQLVLKQLRQELTTPIKDCFLLNSYGAKVKIPLTN